MLHQQFCISILTSLVTIVAYPALTYNPFLTPSTLPIVPTNSPTLLAASYLSPL